MSKEYVNLGLSVKWATMNIGADRITDHGDYFAWGEIKSKFVLTAKHHTALKQVLS